MAATVGGSDKLASLYVEFLAKGGKELSELLDKQKKQLEDLKKAADTGSGNLDKLAKNHVEISKAQKKLFDEARWAQMVAEQGKLQASLTLTQEKLQGLASVGGKIFAGGLGLMLGTAAAGSPELIGTLTDSFRLLAGAIGEAFIPQILTASEYLQKAAEWVTNLSDAQKEAFGHWIAWATAIGGVVMLLPKFVGLLNLGITAVKGLAAAFTALNLSTGGILLALAAIAGVMLKVQSSAGEGSLFGKLQQSFESFMKALQPLIDAFGELFKELRPVLEAFGQGVIELAKLVAPALSLVVQALTTLIRWIKEAVNAVLDLAPGRKEGRKAREALEGEEKERKEIIAARAAAEIAKGHVDVAKDLANLRGFVRAGGGLTEMGRELQAEIDRQRLLVKKKTEGGPVALRERIEMQPHYMSIEGARREFQVQAASRGTLAEKQLEMQRRIYEKMIEFERKKKTVPEANKPFEAKPFDFLSVMPWNW